MLHNNNNNNNSNNNNNNNNSGNTTKNTVLNQSTLIWSRSGCATLVTLSLLGFHGETDVHRSKFVDQQHKHIGNRQSCQIFRRFAGTAIGARVMGKMSFELFDDHIENISAMAANGGLTLLDYDCGCRLLVLRVRPIGLHWNAQYYTNTNQVIIWALHQPIIE